MARSRSLLTALIAAAAVAVPAAFAVPGSAQAPTAGVKVTECAQGSEAKDRFVEFRGVMRQVPGSQTMWMRFGLQERLGDRPFLRVRPPGLGVWRKSRPGVAAFAYRQEVRELQAGSEYRARVRFRWYDAQGDLVRQAVRRSASCREGGQLPNLAVKRIRAEPVTESPGLQRYAIRVVNRGSGATEGADVSLDVDGAAVDTVAVGALAPGQSRDVFVNGPACRFGVRAHADPSDVVVESAESDNVLRRRCSPRS